MPSKKQALVVDDIDNLRTAISQILTREGYEVIQSENGEEALRRIQQQAKSFDLITMDYQMPLKDGAETIEEIRLQNLKVPIICISASLKSMKRALVEKKISDENLYFISKDVFMEELPGVVALLSRQSMPG